TGTGQKGAPYRTIAAGIGAAKSAMKRVYVCDDGTGFSEAITVDAMADASLGSLEIYGGFECMGWTYATTRRAKVAPSSGPALVVSGVGTGFTLVDFDLAAPNANGSGASSIGAIVNTAMNVVLQRVRIASGNGGNGQPGATGAAGGDGAIAGAQQQGVAGVCPAVATTVLGGTWQNAVCGSRGGNGGPANVGTFGFAGLPGTPGPANGGLGGGGNGMDGVAGTPGVNGAAT